MGEILHTSRISIVREKGPTRKAMIEGFAEPVYYGVHGGIKRFYNVEPEKEYPASYITQTTLPDGTEVLLRPIRAEDEPLEHEMLTTLSIPSALSPHAKRYAGHVNRRKGRLAILLGATI